MFGIGFTEILLILIMGVLFIGPDKLPGTIKEIGKFINGVKKTIDQAKSSIDEEIRATGLKDEANNYRKQIEQTKNELNNFKNIDAFEDEDEIIEVKEVKKNKKNNKKEDI